MTVPPRSARPLLISTTRSPIGPTAARPRSTSRPGGECPTPLCAMAATATSAADRWPLRRWRAQRPSSSRGYMSAPSPRADILDNVDPLPSLNGLVRTGGRLDVCKALPGCSNSPPPPPVAPVNSSVPVVSGAAQVGQVLSASTGSWSGSPSSYAYRWDRYSSAGGSRASIAGATASTYTLVGGDVGATIRVAVTASNSGGSATASSAQTAVVSGAVAAPATFGKAVVGGRSDTMAADRKRVNAYSVSSSVSVSKLSIYLQPTGTSGQQVLRGVVYADSGGTPGALVGVSNELSFASTQAAGWYDLTLPGGITLSAGRYWIGMLSGGSSSVAGFQWDPVAGARVYNSNSYTSAPSNPFGGVTGSDGGRCPSTPPTRPAEQSRVRSRPPRPRATPPTGVARSAGE